MNDDDDAMTARRLESLTLADPSDVVLNLWDEWSTPDGYSLPLPYGWRAKARAYTRAGATIDTWWAAMTKVMGKAGDEKAHRYAFTNTCSAVADALAEERGEHPGAALAPRLVSPQRADEEQVRKDAADAERAEREAARAAWLAERDAEMRQKDAERAERAAFAVTTPCAWCGVGAGEVCLKTTDGHSHGWRANPAALVACPTCSAEAGDVCHDRSDKRMTSPHPKRTG